MAVHGELREQPRGVSRRQRWEQRGSSLPERFCTGFVALLFAVILLFLFVLSLTSTCTVYGGDEIVECSPVNPLLMLLTLAAILCALIMSGRRYAGARGRYGAFSEDPDRFCRLLAAAAGLYVLWLILTGFWPISDQRMVMESAKALIHGDFSPWEPYGFRYLSPMEPRGYAYTYPSQNGLILYFAVIEFFFRGASHLAAQLINIVFLFMGMSYLSRLFCGGVFESGSARVRRSTFLLLIFCLPFTFYFTFLYGTVPGFALSALALYQEYRFIRSERWPCFFAAAAAVIAAVFLKSNYLIVLVAMVLYLLSFALFRLRPRLLMAAFLMAALYAGAGRSVNLFLETVTSYPVGQGSPMIAWVEMGLQDGERGPGWFNGYNVRVFSENDLDAEQTSAAVREDLRETLSGFAADPRGAMDFFVRKCRTVWTEPTFQSLWIQQVKGDSWLAPWLTRSLFDEGGALNRVYVAACKVFQCTVYLGALLFLFFGTLERRLTWMQLLPAVIFIGGFLFHLAWEAKSQYTVCYFALLIPYAWAGIRKLRKIAP